jgi:hypothetical protein
VCVVLLVFRKVTLVPRGTVTWAGWKRLADVSTIVTPLDSGSGDAEGDAAALGCGEAATELAGLGAPRVAVAGTVAAGVAPPLVLGAPPQAVIRLRPATTAVWPSHRRGLRDGCWAGRAKPNGRNKGM